jgi:hypothetical protein
VPELAHSQGDAEKPYAHDTQTAQVKRLLHTAPGHRTVAILDNLGARPEKCLHDLVKSFNQPSREGNAN